MNFLRRLVDRSPFRQLLLRPGVRRFIAAVLSVRFVRAAFEVDRPFTFLAREVRKAGPAEYVLRGSGVPVVVCHGESALELLDEIFCQRCYDPPTPLARLIGDAPCIYDVGANVGAFSAFARQQWPEARIVAIEADPANAAALRRFVELDASGRVEAVEAAASISNEPVHFLSGLGSGSLIAEEGQSVVGLDLLDRFGEIDFLKLDIERGEWPILADSRLAEGGPMVIAMEYHRRKYGDTGAQQAARSYLTDAGFEVGHVRPNYWGHGTLWAWRS